jgi:YidC/Oxa1 family membrane protein insertase
MDRNTFTGLFLILIILVGSTFLMQPSDEDIKREKAKQSQDSIARVKKAESPVVVQDSTKTVVLPAIDSTLIKSGPFGSAQSGSNEPIVLENELLKVKISPKGGRIASVELKKFKTYRQLPLIMFEGQGNKFGLIFGAAGKNISTNDLYFQPLGTSVSVANNDSVSLTMANTLIISTL